MSKGFASASAQQANRPKTLEAIVLSQRLNDCFASLQDPRVERTRLHQGFNHRNTGGAVWRQWLGRYGNLQVSKQAWLSSFLALPNGIPSADTFPSVRAAESETI